MTSTNSDEEPEGSSLDHALLESIFYSEMMLMQDDSASLISNSLLSTLAADGSVLQQQETTPLDTQSEVLLDQKPPATTLTHHHPSTHNNESLDSMLPSPGALAPISATSQALQDPILATQQQRAYALPEHDQVPLVSSGGIAHSVVPIPTPPKQQQQQKRKSPTSKKLTKGKKQQQQQQHPSATPALQVSIAAPPVPLSAGTSAAIAPGSSSLAAATQFATTLAPDDGEKRKLVSQFATLASRLGVSLPETVVRSLTQNSTSNLASAVLPGSLTGGASITTPALSVSVNQQACTGSQQLSPSAGDTVVDSTIVPTPVVQQLAQVADAAVAAASRKRSANGGVSSDAGETSGDGAEPSNSNSNTKQPAYSKRRKKPRLQDCESKLGELQAENAMLKRHLANLSSQSHALDQERLIQEQRMRLMLEQGGDQKELDQAIRHFSEMYSDYGRRRHQELSFHLDQLQRLANPTNFTKLGLWTMGGEQSRTSSRNPIASILQKELGISAQQGKKILEQRKRIQSVCSNLKECLGLLANLKTLCRQKTQIFHDRMNKCREILTPRQVVKLIIWINENTEVLDTVCPGWGSEHVHSKTPAARHAPQC